jgi:endonuclease/exonuclease/phosphatase family metal-dependent hydrolase
MNVRFAPIYDFRPRQFGVAILSRYPIVSWKNHEITRLSTQQPNAAPAKAPGFLETVLDIPGERVRVFSTHLDYRSDPSVRMRQVAEMMDIISRSGMPTILAGDLNATPSAVELRPLMAMFQISASEMTYPADIPTKQIDYVLTSSAFSINDSRVYSTDASDHRPVVTTISPCRVRFAK